MRDTITSGFGLQFVLLRVNTLRFVCIALVERYSKIETGTFAAPHSDPVFTTETASVSFAQCACVMRAMLAVSAGCCVLQH
jgi:hypothetical protein